MSSEDGLLSVKVSSPSKIYFEGSATSVTAANDTGEFDVLPRHHNFITLLSQCQLRVFTANQRQESLEIEGGIMHVRDGLVQVFLDI